MNDLEANLKGRRVRLFSSASIRSSDEAEIRATASLLSMVKAVSEFGRIFIKSAGGPVGKIECYTEVTFTDKNSKKESRLDGVIIVTRGKKQWKAFVEVKVGSNSLTQDQFDRYHMLAGKEGFDALVTISNEPALSNGLPPLKVDKRRLNKTSVIHCSWERLLSEAQYLSLQSGVQDEDQQYMLSEWIRYVNDLQSKIIVAPKVGKNWEAMLKAASADRLNNVKTDVEEFSNIWAGFLRIQAFRLRAQLGEKVEVRLKTAEKKDPDLYFKNLTNQLLVSGKICSYFIIPHTAGDLQVLLDLRSKRVFYEVKIDPPIDKKTKGQITWMVNQLKKLEFTPSELTLLVDWKKKGVISEVTISDIEEKRDGLLFDLQGNPIDSNIEIKSFRIHWKTKLTRKKSTLFNDIGGNLEHFYTKVVEHLQVYVPPTPKLRSSDNSKSAPSNTSESKPKIVTSYERPEMPSWWSIDNN